MSYKITGNKLFIYFRIDFFFFFTKLIISIAQITYKIKGNELLVYFRN